MNKFSNFSQTYLSFDQITYDFVVEIFDWSPLNSFLDVFFLFCLESQFNEILLKFLIDIVDTELFESIILENFESENIQNSNYSLERSLELL